MPDHAHLILMGLSLSSDQRGAVRFLRGQSSPFLESVNRVWQREPFDHVLRGDEREQGAFMSTCHYVLQNPVRKMLCDASYGYPFSGAMIPGYPSVDFRKENFWDLFWRLYHAKVV